MVRNKSRSRKRPPVRGDTGNKSPANSVKGKRRGGGQSTHPQRKQATRQTVSDREVARQQRVERQQADGEADALREVEADPEAVQPVAKSTQSKPCKDCGIDHKRDTYARCQHTLFWPVNPHLCLKHPANSVYCPLLSRPAVLTLFHVDPKTRLFTSVGAVCPCHMLLENFLEQVQGEPESRMSSALDGLTIRELYILLLSSDEFANRLLRLRSRGEKQSELPECFTVYEHSYVHLNYDNVRVRLMLFTSYVTSFCLGLIVTLFVAVGSNRIMPGMMWGMMTMMVPCMITMCLSMFLHRASSFRLKKTYIHRYRMGSYAPENVVQRVYGTADLRHPSYAYSDKTYDAVLRKLYYEVDRRDGHVYPPVQTYGHRAREEVDTKNLVNASMLDYVVYWVCVRFMDEDVIRSPAPAPSLAVRPIAGIRGLFDETFAVHTMTRKGVGAHRSNVDNYNALEARFAMTSTANIDGAREVRESLTFNSLTVVHAVTCMQRAQSGHTDFIHVSALAGGQFFNESA